MCRVVAEDADFGREVVVRTEHDWRLIEEREEMTAVGERSGTRTLTKDDLTGEVTWCQETGRTVRRWYCTICRTVEETSA